MPAAHTPLRILVLGHTRPFALRCVLEGLAREGALAETEVWLDGHSGRPALRAKTDACLALQTDYPACRFVAYHTHVGHPRRLLDALGDVIRRHERILVLEDDCFPAPGALEAIGKTLDRIASDPTFFSVYGDPIGLPGEQQGTFAFRCWGWATTREKLEPLLARLLSLWRLPEPEYLQWFARLRAARGEDQPFLVPGQIDEELLTVRFTWDALVPFLLSAEGIRNLCTPKRVLYNFGFGLDSWHFNGSDPRFLAPPFNMIALDDLCRRFALDLPELERRFDVEPERTYRFVSGTDDVRLLHEGFGAPESWGSWTVGEHAVLRFRPPPHARRRRVELELWTRAHVSAEHPKLTVEVVREGHTLATWRYRHPKAWVRRRLRFRRIAGREHEPITLTLRIHGASRPSGADPRRLGLGLVELRMRPC